MKYLKRGLFFFALAFGIAFFMTPPENVDKDALEALVWMASMLIMFGLGTTNVAIAEQIFHIERMEKSDDHS